MANTQSITQDYLTLVQPLEDSPDKCMNKVNFHLASSNDVNRAHLSCLPTPISWQIDCEIFFAFAFGKQQNLAESSAICLSKQISRSSGSAPGFIS